MTSPIAIHPSIMITRIAQQQGASLNTQLAKVAQLRMEMALAQAERSDPTEKLLSSPANGAEVDLLI